MTHDPRITIDFHHPQSYRELNATQVRANSYEIGAKSREGVFEGGLQHEGHNAFALSGKLRWSRIAAMRVSSQEMKRGGRCPIRQ